MSTRARTLAEHDVKRLNTDNPADWDCYKAGGVAYRDGSRAVFDTNEQRWRATDDRDAMQRSCAQRRAAIERAIGVLRLAMDDPYASVDVHLTGLGRERFDAIPGPEARHGSLEDAPHWSRGATTHADDLTGSVAVSATTREEPTR